MGNSTTSEQWRAVVGYEGMYEVSDQGRVRSVDRVVQQTGRKSRFFPGVLLSQMGDRKRYKWVNLRRDGGHKVGKVHRMVAEAFIGPPLPGQVLCHKDGDVQNNCVANLRWGTAQSNSDDMVRMGNSQRGTKAHNAVLTEDIVREARARWVPHKVSAAMLAREYGVCEGTLKSALRRKSWTWLD